MANRRNNSKGQHCIGLLILLAALVEIAVCHAQSPLSGEAQIRADIIYNLTKFVEWPAWKLGDTGKPFVIGVVGDKSVAKELDDYLRGKKVQGIPIIVESITTAQQAEQCHIVYVESSGSNQFKEMFPDLFQAAVLTIGVNPLGDSGIVIGLPLVENRIQIEVDLKNAGKSKLTISSRLLRIARVVR
jgi:hypothetical protein